MNIDKHKNIENIGLLFKVEGFIIFHCGDTNPWNDDEHNIFNLQTERIDIALLDRSFISDNQPNEIIFNYIKPLNIVLMHVEPNLTQKYYDSANQVNDTISSIYAFKNSMEYITFYK